MSKKAVTKLATKLALTEGKLSAERQARVRTSALLDEALAGLPGGATAPAAAPPAAESKREQIAKLPAGSIERTRFALEHQAELCAEADAARRAGSA